MTRTHSHIGQRSATCSCVGRGGHLVGATLGPGVGRPDHQPPSQARGHLFVRGGGMDLPPSGGTVGSAASPGQPVLAYGPGAAACQCGDHPVARHGAGCCRYGRPAP